MNDTTVIMPPSTTTQPETTTQSPITTTQMATTTIMTTVEPTTPTQMTTTTQPRTMTTTTQPPTMPTTQPPRQTMNSEVPMPTTTQTLATPTSTDKPDQVSINSTGMTTDMTTEPETFVSSSPETTDLTTDDTTPPSPNTTAAPPNTIAATSSTTTKPTTTTIQTPTPSPTAAKTTAGGSPRQQGTSPPYYWIGVFLLLVIVVVAVVFFLRYKRSSTRKQRLQNLKRTTKRPIVLSKMEAEVEAFHRDDNLLIIDQFEDLAQLSPKLYCSEANKEGNAEKNRFNNVLPFDHSRVCLPIEDDDVNSDYINANYITGYTKSKEYIATQGPLPDTINDFWRMIWHEKVSIIVMLTSLKEGHTVKCEQYWPGEVGEVMEYGQYTVEKISEVTKKTHTCSTLMICCNEDSQNNKKKECRTVKHFHYLQWKDKSASVERNDILQFIRTVRQNMESNDTSPVVVHCSAGVGRTGTYIALDYIQQYINQHDLNKAIDIYDYVLKLRNNRVLMVQTECQYSFLYDCAVQLIEDKQNKTQDIESGQQDNPDDPFYMNTRDNYGVMTTFM
ncbi:receptor-type tyrosine-protein phosphatase beta isoform X2 [Patella vulgata]|nr:receptor-type tyrosine-protein phosphatase beta isoform X2 [Patella vulgata]